MRAAGVRRVLFDRLNPYPRAVANLRRVYSRRFPWALPALESYLRDPASYLAEARSVVTAAAAPLDVEWC